MASSPVIPWEEIGRHNTQKDCWVVIHDQVWDLTEFLFKHPGGAGIILKYAGRDATKAFSPIHPKDITDTLPRSTLKGSIDPHETRPVEKDQSTTQAQTHEASKVSREQPELDDILNVYDFELVARAKCAPEAWAYLNSGGDDEVTLRENTSAYHRIWLRPRVLRDVKHVDGSTTLLGTKTRLPLYVSATALGKLYHPRGEVELANGCHKARIIQMLPTLASCSLDEMTEARAEGQTQWYQLYVNQDREFTKKVVQKAEQLGVKALFVTVDAPQLGRRERDMRLKANALSNIQRETGVDNRASLAPSPNS